jgi:3',5'-cyclic-nucleotide phosphodiesterase
MKGVPGQGAKQSIRSRHATVADGRDVWLDDFLTKLFSHPFGDALELSLHDSLGWQVAVYWQNVPGLNCLFARRPKLFVGANSLAGFCFSKCQICCIQRAREHEAFDPETDGHIVPVLGSVLLVPLCDERDAVFGVLQLAKQQPVSADDARFAEWLMKKVSLLKHWIDPPGDVDALTLVLAEDGLATAFFERAAEVFECRAFEVWRLDRGADVLKQYGVDAVATVPLADGGVVAQCLQNGKGVTVISGNDDAAFNPLVDTEGESIFCAVVKDSTGVFGFVLRGSAHIVATNTGAQRLEKLIPHIQLLLAKEAALMDRDRESYNAIKKISEQLASRVDSGRIVAAALEKCRIITRSERCSLFLVSQSRDRLLSCHQTGLKKNLNIPMNRGLAGYCITHEQVINLQNAYESPIFDQRVDRKTGFRTRSILVVPIVSGTGQVIGCSEFMNKPDDQRFTSFDTKVVQLFSAFCGLILENSRLCGDLAALPGRIKGISRASLFALKGEAPPQTISELVKYARVVLQCERSAFYSLQDTNLSLVSADGGPFLSVVPTDGILGRIISQRQPIIEPMFTPAELDGQSQRAAYSFLGCPVPGHQGQTLGVLCLLSCRVGYFNVTDLDTVYPFVSICSLCLQNSELRWQAPESDMGRWISPDERSQTAIPSALLLTPEEQQTVNSLACFAPSFRGIGHIKELFYFFATFDLLERFDITAERFFRFLVTVSSRYTDTSYHNWTHACDVAQCVFFMIRVGDITAIYEAWEIFTMLVAAVCHDTNHRGLNNVYNVRAETPLGILYKNQSVLEIHHIHESIPIISRPDIDLFASFGTTEVKKVWSLFVSVILATDMAQHFEIVKRAQAALDNQMFILTEPETRVLALQLVMKVADISNVSRPFEFANMWCDILNEEFFHQGDLEKATGIGLTSPLNDRDSANKPKSQIGFYTFICLPLYMVVAKLFPGLQVQVDGVAANLEKWKELGAAQ